MARIKNPKSAELAAQIEALQARLRETEQAEAAAADAELVALVRRAGMVDEVIRTARQRIEQAQDQRRASAAKK